LVVDAIALDRNRRGFYHPRRREHGRREQSRQRVLRILLAPALIGAASLAGRRWGPAVSGWLVGLPLTSAPVTFLLALEHGDRFAASVALGTLAGTISQALFAVMYAWLARRHRWPVAFVAGSVVFGVATIGLAGLRIPLAPLAGVAGVALIVGLRAMPALDSHVAPSAAPLPRWDLPVRMLVATLIVGGLIGVAPVLGPRLTGLLSPFPVYAAILTVFAHRGQGAPAAIGVLRGLLAGLFGFVGFFVVVAGSIERVGTAAAFAIATLVALAVQLLSLRALRARAS
jgi:hypothetical protein